MRQETSNFPPDTFIALDGWGLANSTSISQLTVSLLLTLLLLECKARTNRVCSMSLPQTFAFKPTTYF